MRGFSGILLSFILLLFIMTGCSSEPREDVMREVRSTDLTSESIENIMVGMKRNIESLHEKLEILKAHPDNDFYSANRNFDQYYLNDDILISVDRETEEILQISILENNYTSESARGINLGSTIEKVILTYGENYYTFEDKDQSIYEIGFIDHTNNLDLSFRHFEGEVKGISLGYAFDKIKWE